MAVQAVGALAPGAAHSLTTTKPAGEFRQIFEQHRATASLERIFELPKPLVDLAQRVSSGTPVSLPQMMVLQTHLHQLSTRVEVAARAADGLLASARKLQNQQ